MSDFVHVHSSSRYDRSTKLLQAAIDTHRTRDNAKLITFTEMGEEHREKVLRNLDGWGSFTGDHGGGDDCAVAWDKKEFKFVKGWSHKLTDKTYFSETGNKVSPKYGITVILYHIPTQRVIVVSVAHLPPTVEGGEGWSRVRGRVDTWVAGAAGWKKFVNTIAKSHHVDGVLIVADWNLNIRKSWVQWAVKTRFRRFRLLWQDFPRSGGTHGDGDRIIDFSLTRGRLTGGNPTLLPDEPSSDHRPYKETLSLPLDETAPRRR